MNSVLDLPTVVPLADTPTVPEPDLATAVRNVLEASREPLTVARLRSGLPRGCCPLAVDAVLVRQVAAKVIYQYPKYRSQQERYWDQPMAVHVGCLIRAALRAAPLAWSELRRKLPAYAQSHAETVVQTLLADGVLHQHPRVGRSGPRYGVRPPDVKACVRLEMSALFERLGRRGFSTDQLRAAALDVLHEAEWAESSAVTIVAPAPSPLFAALDYPADAVCSVSSGG